MGGPAPGRPRLVGGKVQIIKGKRSAFPAAVEKVSRGHRFRFSVVPGTYLVRARFCAPAGYSSRKVRVVGGGTVRADFVCNVF